MSVFFAVAGASADAEYRYKETRDIIALVRDATALLEEKGEAAFPEFRKEGSPWFYGDTYIFIWQMDGLRVVYPPDPKGEGKNMRGLRDITGKPIGTLFISMVSGEKEEAWCHYQWPKPGETAPTWKTTFLKRVKAPSGRAYVMGCGIYDMKIEKQFVVDLVEDAAALINREGVDVFRDRAGEFMYQDVYVFVTSEKGVELVNPAFPDQEGKYIGDVKDAEGNYAVRDMFELLKKNDTVWKEGLWPKPGTNKPARKVAYIKKVVLKGEVLAVGAGYYPE